MALTPQQKALRELESDDPEAIAWGLMEWIRLVEGIPGRDGVLSAYAASLATAKGGSAAPGDSSAPATGTQRKYAFKLMHLIAEIEGRDYGQRNQGDRAWVLDCYAECVATVQGKRVETPVVADAAEVEAVESVA